MLLVANSPIYKRLRNAKRLARRWALRYVQPRDREVDSLFGLLYDQVHDLEQSREIFPTGTLEAFSRQWKNLPQGDFLLSDPTFKSNVDQILSEQEIQIRKDWFQGKKVLDAGCGSGRWAYGFSRLGADLVCVDGNATALAAAKQNLSDLPGSRRFIHSRLEALDEALKGEKFDLVFSWGVLHHCVGFKAALKNVLAAVREGGIVYLYLYGRESLSRAEDIELFKKRLAYNAISDEERRLQFLLSCAGGDHSKVHGLHDIYAPMINRRFDYAEVQAMLESAGFTEVTRTIDHTEVFIRAVRGLNPEIKTQFLPKRKPPYWFQGNARS